MSVNTAHAQFGGVLIFSGERILIYCDGVEMGFDCKDLAHFKGTKKGRIYLTTHRVIFTNKKKDDMLQSFNMPFYCMREVELEQPVFGANYIKGRINPENNGWMGECRFKLWFTSGGAIEFGTAMLKAGQLDQPKAIFGYPAYSIHSTTAQYTRPSPPAYTPPQANYGWVPYTTFPTAPPPPPLEYSPTKDKPRPRHTRTGYPKGHYLQPLHLNTAPTQTSYSWAWYPTAPPYKYKMYNPTLDKLWVPYTTFPTAPPPEYVYTTEAPPPYPGVDSSPPYPPPQTNGFAADAKAQEAAGGAYYNPSNPHNVYVPNNAAPYQVPPYSAPQYGAPPPSYSEAAKKNN
ncbi:WW domain-binding protein 2-like [Argopecten irradians]|uniref:WW domain-binding protein 2-like n=1 Tax=Argopecten irradians TaxID=31199 RepID=UPI003722E60D